jgi:hypothetical protein
MPNTGAEVTVDTQPAQNNLIGLDVLLGKMK